ncbi:hypothetical protein [Leucobacter sp. GX24907]
MLDEDLLAAVGQVTDGLVRACGQLVELVHKHALQCVTHCGGKGDALVVVGDEPLDPANGRVGHVAGGALVVTAQADEIRVDVAVPILGVNDCHPLPAPAAVQ